MIALNPAEAWARVRAPRRQWAVWGVVVVAATAWFGPGLAQHVRGALDPFRFADDARNQVMPYLRWVEPEAFAGDFVSGYGLDTIPIGVQLLFWFGSLVVDPIFLSELLTYVLLALTLVGAGGMSRRLAPAGWRNLTMVATLALVLGAQIYLERITGTLPRAFGYPLFALGGWMLVEGRLRRASLVAALGAAFYPTGAVLLAGAVFAVLIILPARARGELRPLSLRQRGGVLAGLALAMLLAVVPTLWATAKHGPRVTAQNLNDYPEGGPGGTHGPDDRPPYDGVIKGFDDFVRRGAFGSGRPAWAWPRKALGEVLLFDLAALAAMIGWFRRGRRPRVLRFGGLVLGVALGHALARVLAPYMYAPGRMVMYSVPLLTAVALPVGWSALLSDIGRRGRPVATLVFIGIALTFVGSGTRYAGLTVKVDEEQQRLYRAVSTLPPSVVVAGWPDEAMSNLPYVSRRRAYMTGEMHIGYHVSYLEQLRTRLYPFFEAYLAREVDPLRRLRDQFGVTHILVERRHFTGRGKLYMQPYAQRIRKLWHELGQDMPAVLSRSEAFVFQSPRYILVDLSRF